MSNQVEKKDAAQLTDKEILSTKNRWPIFIKLFALLGIVCGISEMIGTVSFPVGPGKFVILPMIFAMIIVVLFTPDALGRKFEAVKKICSEKEVELSGSAIMLVLLILGVKLGTAAGPNIEKLIAAVVKLENTLNQFKVLVLSGVVVLFTQFVNLKGDLDVITACLGMLAIVLISLISLKIKEHIPLKIPAFAWASLLSLLLTTPWSPVADLLLRLTKQISAGQIGTVILAVAGVSIGTRLSDIKKLSWKIIIIAIVVFIGTFFGSALVSELILKMQGII